MNSFFSSYRRDLKAGFESLEPRWAQAQFGIAWDDSMHLSMSIVPDGTQSADLRSNLIAALTLQMPRSQWQAAIFNAAEKWMSVANVNIGILPDRGSAFGSNGPTQGDSRFGDIRIGGFRMDPSVLAVSVPPGSTAGTISGDIFLNTSTHFNAISLEATVLHELGHALGLPHSNDPQSVMFSHSNNITQLSASDVQAIQSLYGVRTVDLNETVKSNDAQVDATRIRYSQVSGGYTGSTPLVTWGDLTTPTDVDYFFVPSLVGYTGPMTIRLQTGQISLVTPRVTVMNSAGAVLGELRSLSTSADTLMLQIPATVPDTRYYIKVEAAPGAKYPVGRFGLAVTFDRLVTSTSISPNTVLRGNYEGIAPERIDQLFKNSASALFEDDLHTNDSVALAVNLRARAGQSDRHFSTYGALSDSIDIDVYRVRTPNSGGNWVLTATALASDQNPVMPRVVAVDANNVELPSQIIANGNRTYSIQLTGVAKNQSIYLRVDSAIRQTGNYTLFTSFGTVPAQFDTFVNATVQNPATPVSGKLYVAVPQLFNFALSPLGTSGVVTFTLRDSKGTVIEQLSCGARNTRTSISRMLAPGEYSFTFTATVPQSFRLRGSRLTDPMGPVIDSTILLPQYTSSQSNGVYTYPDGGQTANPYYWLILLG